MLQSKTIKLSTSYLNEIKEFSGIPGFHVSGESITLTKNSQFIEQVVLNRSYLVLHNYEIVMKYLENFGTTKDLYLLVRADQWIAVSRAGNFPHLAETVKNIISSDKGGLHMISVWAQAVVGQKFGFTVVKNFLKKYWKKYWIEHGANQHASEELCSSIHAFASWIENEDRRKELLGIVKDVIPRVRLHEMKDVNFTFYDRQFRDIGPVETFSKMFPELY